uniref:SOSS complex subunit C-like n=1 Tax=Myxine glutinosa TaxID=7769 RepID=UPI00358DDDAD
MSDAQSYDDQRKNRLAILAELNKEKKKLLQTQSVVISPLGGFSGVQGGFRDLRDQAEQHHVVEQQKAALQHAHLHSFGYFITQDSAFGNLILPVLPRLDPE